MLSIRRRTACLALSLAAALLTAPALAGHHNHGDKGNGSASKSGSQGKQSKSMGNLVQVASEAGQFNTLLAAAKAAGLAETLAGDGPFTVFAPTDAAFDKLPNGTVEHLLDNPEQLKQILLHHVVSGKVYAKQALKAGSASTLYGQPIHISADDNGATVAGANIVKTDVKASNGVIHVVDTVLLPKDIVGVAMADDRFSTLVAALQAGDLVRTLQGEGPFTVFAPTNAAFEKLPAGTVETLLKPENQSKLVEVLTYHVVSGAVSSDQVVELDAAETLQGESVTVEVDTSGEKPTVMIDDAKVVITDIKATNGVVHVIDSVLLPGQ